MFSFPASSHHLRPFTLSLSRVRAVLSFYLSILLFKVRIRRIMSESHRFFFNPKHFCIIIIALINRQLTVWCHKNLVCSLHRITLAATVAAVMATTFVVDNDGDAGSSLNSNGNGSMSSNNSSTMMKVMGGSLLRTRLMIMPNVCRFNSHQLRF